MLSSFRKGAGMLAVVTTVFGATGALAEARNVLIVDGAYFPALTHVQPGDQLVFINNSTTNHTITGANDAWTSGPIPVLGSYTLDVDADTPETFTGAGSEADAAVMEGAISFDAVATE
ncbi:hypothetical protein SAMN04489759_102559 [Sulfitobacter delicatus]|uniref:Plastocyanin n=2 Tax=Sulfitobacter delicatus TaxID=218672 RepID=A0A1G7MIL2_9RHOB|nr:hypothetical protein SAMN04489759_102559 [Sulfitobacter delicatus]